MTTRTDYPPYSMIIEWDPRGNIYVVTVPEFERCHTHGHDYEEAARNGRLAIETAVDLDRSLGQPLPAPIIFDDETDHSEVSSLGIDATREVDTVGYPPYSMILEWDPRSDIFIASIPEFPGARTHGDSYEHAARMGREVLEMFVDLAREDGKPLPPVRIFGARQLQTVA